MNSIKDVVSGLLENYGTLNPFELCECLNIKILKSNLGAEIKGFFQKIDEDRALIHISTEVQEQEVKYICAHELGHAVLHPEVSLGDFLKNPMQIKNKYEIAADKFAAEILIDREIKDYGYSELNLEQLSSIICVPVKLIEYKLKG